MLPDDDLCNDIAQAIAGVNFDDPSLSPDNRAKVLELAIQALIADNINDLREAIEQAADDLFRKVT